MRSLYAPLLSGRKVCMSTKKKKIFVLDTNVILHDSSCLYHFEENDIVIPITVLEELDHFKKGNETLNYHAREFVRTVDSLSGDTLFKGGISIAPQLGNILFQMEMEFHKDLALNFGMDKPDHHVLNTAYQIAHKHPSKQVILVSKDVNLRMKAKSAGLMAQDYKTDQVKDLSTLYKGHRICENVPTELIKQLYQDPGEFALSALSAVTDLLPNEYLILRNGRASALGVYRAESETIARIDKQDAYGITPRNAEQTFALDALINPEISLVTLSGRAGTGKTLLALAAALQTRKQYRQILVARPVVPLSNRDIGFLPGDIESKLAPYMKPLYDNLGVIEDQFDKPQRKHQHITKFLEEEKLLIEPLAYIRGRSLVRMYFIVDEAQNLTPHEVKTIITRAGEGTKIIFSGDIFQIDHPYLDSQANGLSYLIERLQGQPIYAHINLEKGERSQLSDLASRLL